MGATTTAPTVMKAWVYDTPKGGIENNLRLDNNVPVPSCPADSTLVKVLAMSVNPFDYKPEELPFVGRFVHGWPATPGKDFCGRVVSTSDPNLHKGQLVAGAISSMGRTGTLAEYVVAGKNTLAPVPEGVTAAQAATTGIACTTSYQTLEVALAHYEGPPAKKDAGMPWQGARLFVNGGSGGCGTFFIQLAKLHGCHVTVACSGANAAFVRELGADDVVDYRSVSVAAALTDRVQNKGNPPFDAIIDFIASDFEIYRKAHHYLKEKSPFVLIGVDPRDMPRIVLQVLRPGFLGGGRRPFKVFVASMKVETLVDVHQMLADGRVKPAIEQVIPMENAPEAYRRMKTHRTRGKLVVEVAKEGNPA